MSTADWLAGFALGWELETEAKAVCSLSLSFEF